MKAWHWVAIAAVLVIGFIVVEEVTKPKSGAVNPNVTTNPFVQLGAGIVGALTKVSAPAGRPASSPGSTGVVVGSNDPGVPYTASQGAAYSAAMQDTGYAASKSAGSGGSTVGGGLSSAQSSDPLGVGQLQAPDFNVGVNGADFTA